MFKYQPFIEVNSYHSKTFSLITETEREGYTISVYDEVNKHLVEFHRDLSKTEVENKYEQLKTKYIFDYQKALVANQ